MRRLLLAGAVIGGAVGAAPVALSLAAPAASAALTCGTTATPYTGGGCETTLSSTTSSGGTTIDATAPGVTAEITVPGGALASGTQVSVEPLTSASTSSLVSKLTSSPSTSSAQYVAAINVTWTGTQTAKAPIKLTITDSAIKKGDEIFAYVGGKLTEVGVADADGSATVTFTTDPIFLVLAPARAALANSQAPATPSSTSVPVRIACKSGTVCEGKANLDVARKVNGKWVQKLVATGNFSIAVGQVGTAKLDVTSFGKTVLARIPLYRHFYLGLVTTLNDGQRIIHKVFLK